MRHKIGDEGVLAKPLPVACGCGYVAPAGARIKIRRRVTNQPGNPREVEVEIDASGFVTLHKVKMSKIWFEGEAL